MIGVQYKGYTYLRKVILLVLEDGSLLYNLQDGLYAAISEAGVDPKSVGKAISNAIQRSWEKVEPDVAIKYLGYFDRENCPTNKQFIAGIVEYIKMNYDGKIPQQFS